MKTDIYSVKGRLLNHIAFADLAITQGGNMLVNMYVHVLMNFYNFAEEKNLPELMALVEKAETFPRDVIKLINPAPQESLYEQVMETVPRFKSAAEALAHFEEEYRELGGDLFWMEAESSDFLNPDHMKIMRLARSIQMCKYLLKRENDV